MIWTTLLPSFLASIVEFVEALTIVLVVGVTVNWKSSLIGTAAAVITLAILIAVFGSTLVLFIPIGMLRLIIGIILILFGMQWLKKSILRYSGHMAKHNEKAIFERKVEEAKSQGKIDTVKFNSFGFLTSYKSVLLEGLEVAFIVITFGAAASSAGKFQGIAAASIGAFFAFVIVLMLGIIIREPLAKIPENTLKFIIGIMLLTFGTFWGGEGLLIKWVFDDFFIIVLAVFYVLLSIILINLLKIQGRDNALNQDKLKGKKKLNIIIGALKEVFDFFCGDWVIFWGTAISIFLVEIIGSYNKLPFALPVKGIIFILGISISLIITLTTIRSQGRHV